MSDEMISHDQAREAAQRLINSHFREEPCARIGIPARPGYDDDLSSRSHDGLIVQWCDKLAAAIRALIDARAPRADGEGEKQVMSFSDAKS